MLNLFRLLAAISLTAFTCAAQSAFVSGSVSGKGSATPNDGSGVLDRSEVFFPNSDKVFITGSIDLSNLVAADAVMVGLVNKPTADVQIDELGWSFWENKDAWAHFVYTGSQYRVGLGDEVAGGGEIVQNWLDLPGPIVDFELVIGMGMMDLTVAGVGSVPTKTYGDPHAFWGSATNPGGSTFTSDQVNPEFKNGAYLLVGSFADGSASFSVSAASSVPAPATNALLGVGLLAACYARRRSVRSRR